MKGAAYKKTDLQLHSPRDRSWKGPRPDDGMTEAPAEDILAVRKQWASDFVDACITKGVELAALTDHHEGVYCWHVVEEVKKRRAEGTNFWFMPGMELTCKDSAQALILFDADLPRALFDKVRNLLGMKTDVQEQNQLGIEVELLNYNLEDIQGRLEGDEELKGRFIVMPNVTAEGHKHILRDGFHKRFADMPYVGVYLDKKYPEDLNPKAQRRLSGETGDWGSARGIISTSDSRSANFSNLGEFPTWLKLAAPTAESLRQAMLAADSRISYKDTQTPELYIDSVCVNDAEYLKLDETLQFSYQFSSIIGGRGSGKSTLLEYIRYALGISALDGHGSEWDPTFERRRALLKATLCRSTSKVEIVIVQNSVPIKLTRTYAHPERIVMHVGAKEQSISLEDARTMFDVQAYSQGELSHLGDDKAEKRLFDLITAPNREAFALVEKSIKDTEGDIRKLVGQAVEFWRLESQKRKIDAYIITLLAGIEHTKKGLSGLEPETQEILDKHQIMMQTSRWIEQLNSDYASTYKALDYAFSQHLRHSEIYLAGEAIPINEPAQALAAALREQLTAAGEAYRSLTAAHQNFEQQKNASLTNWKTGLEEHNAQYELALTQSKQYAADLQRLKQLEEQYSAEQRKREELAKKMEPLQEALLSIKNKGGEYISLQNQLSRLSNESAHKLASLTNDQARAELVRPDDVSELTEALSALFKGSGVHSTRLETLMDKIKANDAVGSWWKFLDEILAVLRWKITGLHESEQRPILPLLDAAIDAGGLNKFCEQIDLERVSKALVATVRPRVRLLQKRGSVEIEFSQASQGEKATILLNVLMRQSGGPLLLDQPEEDLDNRIIGDIVAAIHDAKIKKQLIFATHNANLVVNGDAELVVDLAAGAVEEIGAIDLPGLRDSITQTMEGGKDAFELRRLKYNF